VRDGWRVASYRFRATFARRRAGLLAIVLLIGLTGGIALGSLAGARRTQSSYPRFLASTNPSDLTVTVFNTSGGSTTDLTAKLTRLPDVVHVAAVDETTHFVPLNANGVPDINAQVTVVSSTDGELFDQDRLAIVHGRMVDPARSDEVVLTASAARQSHVHIGQVVPVGLFSTANARAPSLRVDVKVVGIVVFNNGVVQDDIDAAYGFVVVTPALLREVIAKLPATAVPFTYGLQLAHGSRDVATVEREVVGAIPGGEIHQFHATAPVVTQVEEATRPESIALGAFGVIAMLVTLVIAAQAIARQLRLGNDDRAILRALGASRGVASADGVIGVILAVLLGAALALAVAVALSPLTPLGPVRAVYPASGVAFDWTVLGIGFAALVVTLAAVAATIAISQAPHRVAGSRAARPRRSRAASAATNAGLPTPTVTGVRYALERGAGRAAVPVRSALIGTVLAVAMVCATLTFASSLHTLVSRPKLYGWNWTYMINPSMAVPPITRTLLDRDRDVTWTPVDYDLGVLDGQTVPTLLAKPNAAIAPPTLTGHGLEADDQIVIGKETLARLHKHVGQTVVFTYGTSASKALYIPPRTLRIVGTATFPAVGFLSFVADHTSMGTGALLPMDIRPPAFRKAALSPDPLLNGPDLVFVRVRPGASATVARAGLQRIVRATDKALNADPAAAGNNITLIAVQRPAQIVNYRSIGAAPELLAVGLALGAVFALGLTLTASVRRRRRELALLKTLGFTRRQLAATVAAQATVIAVIGIVIGIPAGIVAGRWLWTLFARAISAVPQPTVPTIAIVAVGTGSLVLANLVAAIPGRLAARTPAALLLQAE
jgi:hypothetical protein